MVISNRATIVALVLMVAAAALQRRRLGSRDGLPVLVVLLGLGTASALWSIDPANTLGKAAQVTGVAALLVAMMGYAGRWTDAERARLGKLALIGWGVSAAIPLLDFAAHGAIVSTVRALGGAGISRLNAPHLVEKAGVTVLALAAFPVLVVVSRLRYGAIAAAAVFAVSAAAAVIVSASAAMLLLVVGVAVWGLHRFFPRAVRYTLGIGVPVMIFAMPLLPMLVDPEPVARAIPHFNTSNLHRLYIWDFVYDCIVQRPWFGWGLDSARVIPGGSDVIHIAVAVPWSDHVLTKNALRLPLHPHNGGLQIWLELGGVGALCLAAAMARLFWTQIGETADDSPMAGFLAAAAVPMFVSFGLFQSWWLALVVIVWGALRAVLPAPR